ncbi:MAG: PAAR-like protein [Bacteroidota bacterium]
MTKASDLITNTLKLECDKGMAKGLPMTVTNKLGVKNKGQEFAHAADGQPLTNIPLFGICAALTKKANGTPTTCVHNLSEWKGLSTSVNIGKERALLKTAKLTCTSVPDDPGTIKSSN